MFSRRGGAGVSQIEGPNRIQGNMHMRRLRENCGQNRPNARNLNFAKKTISFGLRGSILCGRRRRWAVPFSLPRLPRFLPNRRANSFANPPPKSHPEINEAAVRLETHRLRGKSRPKLKTRPKCQKCFQKLCLK